MISSTVIGKYTYAEPEIATRSSSMSLSRLSTYTIGIGQYTYAEPEIATRSSSTSLSRLATHTCDESTLAGAVRKIVTT